MKASGAEILDAALETRYRQGYAEGFARGVDALWLLTQEGQKLDFDTGYSLALEFSLELLKAWQNLNPYVRLKPPSLAGEQEGA